MQPRRLAWAEACRSDAKASKEFVGGAYCVFSKASTQTVESQGEKDLGPVAKMIIDALKNLSEVEKAAYA